MNNDSSTSSTLQDEDSILLDKQLTSHQRLPFFIEKKEYFCIVSSEHAPCLIRYGNAVAELISSISNLLKLNGHPVNTFHRSNGNMCLPDLQTKLNGRRFYILAVPGSMVQTTAQCRFNRAVEYQGYGYIIVKSFEDFLMVYNCVMEPKPATADGHI